MNEIIRKNKSQENNMNITKITSEANVNYDPYLVETLIKSEDTTKVKTIKSKDVADWSTEILKDGLDKLENNIQFSDDSSPLSYNSAPTVETMKDAQKVLSEINTNDLVKNVNDIFSGLNTERISNLFLEEADVVV